MARLNVVSAGADRELDAIRATIATFDTASSFDDLHMLLQATASCGRRAEVLDAIGHSCSHGFLVLGSWLVDDSPQVAASFRKLLRPWLQLLGVRTIRLLGCSTAVSQRSRRAIRRIEQATSCFVLGTKRYIGRRDYDGSGFIRDEVLVGPDGGNTRTEHVLIPPHSESQARSS